MQNCIKSLKSENTSLKDQIEGRFGEEGAANLVATHRFNQAGENGAPSCVSDDPGKATTLLDNSDFALMRALQSGQQNFVITDPRLPDNPIVHASEGFLQITGYELNQVLGRNCRFIQGPETDTAEVERIRNAVTEGVDISSCILNYRIDGSSFWNQVYISPLRNRDGEIVNYVGVQCEVSSELAKLRPSQPKGEGEEGVKDDGKGFDASADLDGDVDYASE